MLSPVRDTRELLDRLDETEPAVERVLLDFDGVVMDSEPHQMASYATVLGRATG